MITIEEKEMKADTPVWRQQLRSDNTMTKPLYIEMNKRSKNSRREGYNNYERRKGYSLDDVASSKNVTKTIGSRSLPEGGVISKSRKFPVIKTTVNNLNLECVKPQRAGVIIYTVVEGATYFGLGLDSRTHDLTDFGGGVIYKKDHNVIKGALREFEEETLQIFEKIIPDDIKKCPVIYDEQNLIIFIHMEIDPDAVCYNFNTRYNEIIELINVGTKKKMRDPEVCGITWLNWEDFQKAIKNEGIMFSRVQRFLNRAEDFSYLL